MAKARITIIGLGLTGSSIGAALKAEASDFEIMGHDKEPSAAAEAKRRGHVDRTEWNLYRSIAGAGLIILAIPVQEIPEILEMVKDDLPPGTVILCISDVMQPVLDFGQRLLPDQVHLVVGHPVLTGLGSDLDPSAALLREIPFCIAGTMETSPEAMELVNNLVQRIEATPIYLDPTEHDGLVALVAHLPRLLGAGLMAASSRSATWRDGKKLAGRHFAQSTDFGHNGRELVRTLFVNRENVLRSLTAVEEVLQDWRAMLEQEDEVGLEKALLSATEERIRWAQQARLQDWDRVVQVDQEEGQSFMRQMFFGNLFGGLNRRRPGSQGDEEKKP